MFSHHHLIGVAEWQIGRAILLANRREPDYRLSGETFTLPIEIARVKAREILDELPQGGYMTIVECWRQLADGQIEFTMRRLRTADKK